MNKVMKKVLSVMLALVMMIGIMPLTAKAATELPVGSSAQVTYDGTNIAYTYNADKTGTLTITFYTNNYYCNVYEGNDTSGNNVGGSYYGLGDTVTANVEAGKSYYIDIWATAADEMLMLYAEFEEGSAGGSTSGATPDSAIELTSGSTISLNGMEAKYYVLPATNGTEYTLTVQGGRMDSFDVSVYNPRLGSYGYAASAQYGMPATTTVMGMDGCVRIMVQETGRMSVNAIVTLEEVGAAGDVVGTEAKPDELPVNEELANPISLIANERGAYLYYYTWTATETGKLSITMIPRVCTNGSYQYSVSGGEWETLFLDSVDYANVNPGEYYVKAGETVTVWFSMPDYTAGDVYFIAAFETCEYPTVEEEEFIDIEREDTLLYVKEELVAVDTTHTVSVSDAIHTLYTFAPEEAGVYTITVTEGSIGYYGPNTNVLTNPTNTAQEITVTIQSAGQSAIIGLTDVTDGECDIKIEKVSDVKEETPTTWTDYENKVEIKDFTYDGNFEEDCTYVEVEDDVVETAVLGSDGYYHLNTADGPIVYVKLDGLYGSINPLGAANNDALMGIYDNENNLGYNYSNAYKEYYAAADEKTGLYPLTADLMQMYQIAGATQGWYNANLDGVTTEDGWMFNCYYAKGTTGGTTGGTSTGTTTGTTNTGDSANVAVWAIVMVVAAGAAFVVAESKRRAR